MKKFDDIIVEFNKHLESYFKCDNPYNEIIYKSCSYSLNAGGKRVRPLLLFLTYSMYKNDYKEILDVGMALEMIHTYSLIHDDLPCMDNDDLRRGNPTNHKVFGENIAVLAGDALLNEAMVVLMRYSLNANNNSAIKASYEIALAAGIKGMIGGQVVDIIDEGKNISKDELKYMHSHKTGALIKASIISGAILGGASDDEIQKLSIFGEKLGLVFQIKDDILDVISTTEELGKMVKADEENNKTNFITTFGLERCEIMCKDLTSECINILESLSVNSDDLIILTKMLLNRDK